MIRKINLPDNKGRSRQTGLNQNSYTVTGAAVSACKIAFSSMLDIASSYGDTTSRNASNVLGEMKRGHNTSYCEPGGHQLNQSPTFQSTFKRKNSFNPKVKSVQAYSVKGDDVNVKRSTAKKSKCSTLNPKQTFSEVQLETGLTEARDEEVDVRSYINMPPSGLKLETKSCYTTQMDNVLNFKQSRKKVQKPTYFTRDDKQHDPS